jgi:hypothetical protein
MAFVFASRESRTKDGAGKSGKRGQRQSTRPVCNHVSDGYPACEGPDARKVNQARREARDLAAGAIEALAPSEREQHAATFEQIIGPATDAQIDEVLGHFVAARSTIDNVRPDSTKPDVRCAEECPDASWLAYHTDCKGMHRISFCRSGLEKPKRELGYTLLHEVMHAEGLTAEDVYHGSRMFDQLAQVPGSPAKGNADSYAMFAQRIAGRQGPFGEGPQDEVSLAVADRKNGEDPAATLAQRQPTTAAVRYALAYLNQWILGTHTVVRGIARGLKGHFDGYKSNIETIEGTNGPIASYFAAIQGNVPPSTTLAAAVAPLLTPLGRLADILDQSLNIHLSGQARPTEFTSSSDLVAAPGHTAKSTLVVAVGFETKSLYGQLVDLWNAIASAGGIGNMSREAWFSWLHAVGANQGVLPSPTPDPVAPDPLPIQVVPWDSPKPVVDGNDDFEDM